MAPARLYYVALSLFSTIGFAASATCVDPTLNTSPYVPPWQTLPSTPTLSGITDQGTVTVDDGARLWYGISGQKLSKDIIPVLFLHGGFANSNYLANQVNCLTDTYSIISIDSRGHGRSTDGPGPITYDRMTQDVIQVLDHLGVSSAKIVGWSDGGIIGLNLAMNFTSRVDRLFAYGASYSPDNSNSTGSSGPVPSMYFDRVGSEYAALSPTPDHWHDFSDKMNTLFATLPQWSSSSFQKIPNKSDGAPLIWIVDGEQEEIVNRNVPTTLRDWIPGSQLMLLPAVSHFGFLQDPVTFTTAVSRLLSYH